MMSPKAIMLLAIALLSSAALLQGCGGGGGDSEANTVPGIAGKNGNLTTLVAALKAAGLVKTLEGAGPFTVFAPSNDAFDALSFKGAELKYLLNNKDKLTEVLEYHVASGDVTSGDLKNGQKIKMLMGGNVTITIVNKTVKVNNATVTTADVNASNGVVHIIDKVLMPDGFSAPLIPEKANSSNLTTLVAALKAADLVDALKGGPLTVFAPSNDAFAALPKDLLTKLLDPANVKVLTQILKYHVHSGEVVSSDLKNGENVTTLEGKNLNITIADSKVQVDKATVTKADVFAVNGVVHVIDKVLVPPDCVLPQYSTPKPTTPKATTTGSKASTTAKPTTSKQATIVA